LPPLPLFLFLPIFSGSFVDVDVFQVGNVFEHACSLSGWPDEFVKKSPKMLPNPYFWPKLINNYYSGKT
jgi:hypothetical protein